MLLLLNGVTNDNKSARILNYSILNAIFSNANSFFFFFFLIV